MWAVISAMFTSRASLQLFDGDEGTTELSIYGYEVFFLNLSNYQNSSNLALLPSWSVLTGPALTNQNSSNLALLPSWSALTGPALTRVWIEFI